MANRTVLIGCGGLVALALATAAEGQIGPQPPNGATVLVAIDGGVPITLPVERIPLGDGTGVRYVGSTTTADQIELAIDFIVDDVNDPMLSASGLFKCANGSGATRGFDATISFPVCPATSGGTLLGGTVSLLVTTDAGGGGMVCLPGAENVWDVIVSDEAVHQIFWCPYQMTTTGMGSMQSNAFFGAPVPSLPGPDAATSIGSRNRFSLTAGESLTITSTLIVKSLGAVNSCPGDLNGDGAVDGVDLAEFIAQWGDAGMSDSCGTGDLNADGIIDGGDLAFLIGHWGACP